MFSAYLAESNSMFDLLEVTKLSIDDMIEILNDESRIDKRRYTFERGENDFVIMIKSKKTIRLSYVYELIDVKSKRHVDGYGELRKFIFPADIVFKTVLI